MSKIAVLAGAPWMRITKKEDLQIDPQSFAFGAALKFAQAFRERVHKILLMCDTQGEFQNTLLLPQYRRRIRRVLGMNLGMFIPEVTEHFAEAADGANIHLKQIAVVTRESLEGTKTHQHVVDYERKERAERRKQRGHEGERKWQSTQQRHLLRTMASLLGQAAAPKSVAGVAAFAQYDHRILQHSRLTERMLHDAIRLGFATQPEMDGKKVQTSFQMPRLFHPAEPEVSITELHQSGEGVIAVRAADDSDLLAEIDVPGTLPPDIRHGIMESFRKCLRLFKSRPESAI